MLLQLWGTQWIFWRLIGNWIFYRLKIKLNFLCKTVFRMRKGKPTMMHLLPLIGQIVGKFPIIPSFLPWEEQASTPQKLRFMTSSTDMMMGQESSILMSFARLSENISYFIITKTIISDHDEEVQRSWPGNLLQRSIQSFL